MFEKPPMRMSTVQNYKQWGIDDPYNPPPRIWVPILTLIADGAPVDITGHQFEMIDKVTGDRSVYIFKSYDETRDAWLAEWPD